MTMFGPWYDPDNDPSISPWPGFDPVWIVAKIRGALIPAVVVLIGLATFAIMTSLPS